MTIRWTLNERSWVLTKTLMMLPRATGAQISAGDLQQCRAMLQFYELFFRWLKGGYWFLTFRYCFSVTNGVLNRQPNVLCLFCLFAAILWKRIHNIYAIKFIESKHRPSSSFQSCWNISSFNSNVLFFLLLLHINI